MKTGFEPDPPADRPCGPPPSPPPVPKEPEVIQQNMELRGMERQGLHNTAFGIIRDDTARFSMSLKEKANRYLENLLIAATDELAIKDKS